VKHNVVLITRWTSPMSYARVYKLQESVNVANLIDHMTSNVSFGSWEVMGGWGSLAPFASDGLVVHQSFGIQRQIEDRYADALQPVPRVWDALPPTLADTHIGNELNRLSSLDVMEMPLKDVLALLAEKHEVTITLDKEALKGVSIPEDVPVSRQLANIPLRSLLSLVLRDLDLVWLADKDEIRITTYRDAENNLQRIDYLAEDLVINGRMEPIINVIESTIKPSSWDRVGGPGTLGRAPLGMLTIDQTFDVHLQISALLEELRHAKNL